MSRMRGRGSGTAIEQFQFGILGRRSFAFLLLVQQSFRVQLSLTLRRRERR